MKKKARCLIEKWIDVDCYTCKHYCEVMSKRSPYYPYMGIPSCRLGSKDREICVKAGFERWDPIYVHSVLEVVER